MDENIKPEQTTTTNENDKQDKIVIEYRKPSIITSIMLVLIGFMIATIIYSLLYMKYLMWK